MNEEADFERVIGRPRDRAESASVAEMPLLREDHRRVLAKLAADSTALAEDHLMFLLRRWRSDMVTDYVARVVIRGMAHDEWVTKHHQRVLTFGERLVQMIGRIAIDALQISVSD